MPKKKSISLVKDLIKPSVRQQEFLDAVRDHDYVLYGGAAGGGKSYILRWALVWVLMSIWQDYKIKKSVVGLFCEDYPSLFDRQISKIKFEFPDWLGTLKLGDVKQYTLHEQFGGGVIALRNLDDPSKYLSSEFACIAVDELTKNKQSVFDFLRLRLRWPGIERPKFMGGTNPGGIGHAWVKAYWIDRRFPPELSALVPQFHLVPAKASDNPHLPASYWQSLATLPTAMRQAYADGRWDVFAGQYFDIFDPTTNGQHVKPPQDFRLESWYTRWIGIDWGFQHPAAVYWNAQVDDTHTVTYREFVESGLSPDQLAHHIADLSSAGTKDAEGISAIYMGPDAWAKRTDVDSVADQMSRVFRERGLPQCTQASNDRIGGWALMYDLLRTNRWTIGSNCTKLIQCLPTLVRDEDKVEDIAKVDATATTPGDDPSDAARYSLRSHIKPTQTPLALRVAKRACEIDDPNARIMCIAQIEKEERERGMVIRPMRRHWSGRRFGR